MITHDLILTLAITIGAGLIAWGSMKAGAAFATKELERLNKAVAQHVEADHGWQMEFTQRITKVETLLSEIHRAVVK